MKSLTLLKITLSLFLSLCSYSTKAYAAAIQFSAQVDQNQISIEDTVALKLLVSFDSNANAGEPQFNATDFRVVNEFNSMSVQYDSSRGMQKSHEITEVLQPLKTGNLKISGIRIKVDDQVFSAPDIRVQVLPASASPTNKRPSSKGRSGGGGGGFGFGFPGLLQIPSLRPSNKPNRGNSQDKPKTNAMLRAEVEKSTVYKGEQLIVSYYLYHQMKVFNLQVDKFPVLNGFLREDLEMPIMGQRLDSEQVTIKGEVYQRSLLSRYAAYPLQEGKLDIDSMVLKYNYYSNPRDNLIDDEDPFFSFFQQMSPRAAAVESPRMDIQVLPLPDIDKPKNFVGGVGNFSVTSTVNKYEVKANEAISFVLKIEGKGNVASIKEPAGQWPAGVELYESKGKSQTSRGGVGEKTFEFLLIPRVPGKVTIPPLELGFFDPIKKSYYTKTTEAIDLNVLEPAPGTAVLPNQPNQQGSLSAGAAPSVPMGSNNNFDPKADDVHGLKPLSFPTDTGENGPWSVWRVLYLGCVSTFGILVLVIIRDFYQRRRALRVPKPKWENLHSKAKKLAHNGPWQEVTEAYEILAGLILDSIDRRYQVGARSISRTELKIILTEKHGLPVEIWDRIASLLEFADLVRFASSLGAVSESEVRLKLAHWVGEAELLVRSFT